MLFDDENKTFGEMRNWKLHTLNPDICLLYYSMGSKYMGDVEIDGAKGMLFHNLSRKKRHFFSASGACPEDFDGIVYSALPICKNFWSETVYDLSEIDKRENYSSKKSFYNSTKAPTAYCTKNGISVKIVRKIDVDEYLELYEKWVKQKLDAGVHRMSFTIGRYRKVIKEMNANPNIKATEARDAAGKLIAFDIVLIDDDTAYDLVFCSDLSMSQLSNAFGYKRLILLCDEVSFFNCGPATGKLKKYKCQFPHTESKVYVKDMRK